MQAGRPLKLLFVVNPVSGGNTKNVWVETIQRFYRTKPHSIHFHELNGKNDAEALGQEIQNILPDRVVAVGGDGTVNLVAKSILGRNTALAILPAGSANGFAKELQLPANHETALEIIENGTVQSVDIVRINNNVISLHLADIGLNAQLVKYFEEDNWRGKLGYARVLLKTLWRGQRLRVQIETDQETVVRKVYMVVLANSKTYGTGVVINPNGNLRDGKFEVVIVRKLALSELLKMIFRHRIFDPQKVEVLQTKKLLITSNRRAYFQSDGEYLGKVNVIRAEIVPGELKIMVPNSFQIEPNSISVS